MIQKISADKHKQPYKGFFTATRIQPSDIFEYETNDPGFGPLAIIDYAVMKRGLTIKMHEHKNDEILSYVRKGTSYHRDSCGYEVPLLPGKLMFMNAGSSFWHEEKVKIQEEDVEMLQILIRPRETDLEPMIQFHDKEMSNRKWYCMVGPELSNAPLHVRQNIYIFDAHPKKGDRLEVPVLNGYKPFLYVMNGEIQIDQINIQKLEAVTDLEQPLSPLRALSDATVLLFLVDMHAPMSMAGTISGMKKI